MLWQANIAYHQMQRIDDLEIRCTNIEQTLPYKNC